jgi:DNA mismatch repair protein MutL
VANKIKILSESLASKIAAGEVVQRPASVVKELLENSIDSGATKITVVIKDGGKTYIQVTDNGCGMNKEDAVISFQRHATSKIISLEDLENIKTLGFRGEALASIAAVSHVELISKTSRSDLATKIRIEGIEIKENSQAAAEQGTSVTVKNLFFNTPARRNFLKNNTAEFKHIFDVVVRAAISNPEIAIKFISADEAVFNLPVSSLADRITNIFGERIGKALMSVENRSGEIAVNGYVSRPDFSRKTRAEQFLFLNSRYIVSRNLNFAVHQAYENLLEKGSYPFFILFLTLDPRRVDVNVHPSKMEVKFQDERGAYHAINAAVRNTLAANNLVPSVSLNLNDKELSKLMWTPTSFPQFTKFTDFQHPTEKINSIAGPLNTSFATNETSFVTPTSSKEDKIDAVQFKCYQLHNQYIIVPTSDGVMIIDQHAAHERILYEKTIAIFNSKNFNSQQLLFPYTLEFTAGDAALVKVLNEDLVKLGFQLKVFGQNTIIVEGIPPDVKPGREEGILQEVIDLYKENEHTMKLEPRDNLAKSFACKAAIKFGDPLNQDEMRFLIEILFKTQMPYVCPHGRPSVINLSLSELAKRFGRSG